MAGKRKKKAGKEIKKQVKGILLLALAVYCYAGLLQAGETGGVGRFAVSVMHILAGEASLFLPLFIIVPAICLLMTGDRYRIRSRVPGLLLLALLAMIQAHLNFMLEALPAFPGESPFMESFRPALEGSGGGIIGGIFAVSFYYSIGITGSRILLTTLALVSAMLILNLSVGRAFEILGRILEYISFVAGKAYRLIINPVRRGLDNYSEKARLTARVKEEARSVPATLPAGEDEQDKTTYTIEDWRNEPGVEAKDHPGGGDYQRERKLNVSDFPGHGGANDDPLPAVVAERKTREPADYIFPGKELLAMPATNGDRQVKNSRERAGKLENTLHNFGVRARVTHVQSGPTVTRFEVQPEAGVKVSKIIALSDDLALNLAAPLVRIEAPIPGKAALGIEVPNSIISPVHLREVIEETAFKQSVSPLTIALGKDITGVPVVSDLAKMPHLLIAGATGAGKSVCLNTLITSILYKAHPEQLRFMMIDPKVVELSVYNGIPHLLMPVLTDPRKASLALRNMVREMGRRYELFARLGVRDIGTYSGLSTTEPDLEDLPYIVVIIDELADLMYVSPGEVEDAIARLAQMSRAAGIHLIVATQRPSVDVLTGIIKANITSRIAFTVSSQVDSRTILDMAGAEKLLGRGDMLFYPVGAVKPFRVQGAYISEAEVKKVTDFIKKQGLDENDEGSTYMEAPEEPEEEETDALFFEAVDLVVRTGQASISLLQRRFRIGYTRAARLIDDLERRGVVGQFEGSKPREILITSEQAARICEEGGWTAAE